MEFQLRELKSTAHKLYEQLRELNDVMGGRIVFVGGVVEYLYGSKDTVKDIDCCVWGDVKPLTTIGPVVMWDNGRRMKIRSNIKDGYKMVDIFKKFPTFKIFEYEGLKFATMQSVLDYHHYALDNNWRWSDKAKEKSRDTINRLTNFINGKFY